MKNVIFFIPVTDLLPDQKCRFQRTEYIALYVAALSTKACSISAFQGLIFQKSDCPLPILKSLQTLSKLLYTSHSNTVSNNASKHTDRCYLSCDKEPVLQKFYFYQ